jgi:hypothetical protein
MVSPDPSAASSPASGAAPAIEGRRSKGLRADRGELGPLTAFATLALFLALAAVHTWPLASDPAHLARTDTSDATLDIWILGWIAHIIPRAPLRLFEAPMFHPEPHTLAYADHLLVQGLMGAPLQWLGGSPVLAYSVLLLLGLALSGWAMSLVVARWTGSTAAGVIAGLLYAFNALMLMRFFHLQVQHTEFMPLMWLALDRVLERNARRDTWLLTAAFVLQALCSNYFLVFGAFSILAVLVVRPGDWLARGRGPVIVSLLVCAVVSGAAIAPFLWPYYAVYRQEGMSRGLAEVARNSARWQDYLATGGRLHYALWSQTFVDDRTTLFPGIIGVLLAVIPIASGRVWRDRRARMAIPIGLLGFILSFGPGLPGYAWLHTHTFVGGLRVAARWGWLLIASVAMLAGFGTAAIESAWRTRWPSRRAGWTALVVMIGAGITLEAVRAPVGFMPFHGLPRVYDRIGAEPHPVLAEFPVYFRTTTGRNAPYLLNDTRWFEPLINGYSGWETHGFQERGRVLAGFPDRESIALLRQLGVTLVAVHLAAIGPDRARAIDAVPGLQLIEEAEAIRLYRLR